MKKYYKILIKRSLKIIILFVYLNIYFANSQDNNSNSDTLIEKSYEYLKKGYILNFKDSIKQIIYSNAYLDKAKKENNTNKIITGLLIKGNYFYIKRNFSSSIDYHIKAYDLAKNKKKESYLNRINHNIGSIRGRSGEYRKALRAFNRSYEYYSKYPDSMLLEKENYYITLFSIANIYRRLHIEDSARYYLEEGLEFIKGYNEKGLHYQNFILTKVILDFDYQGKYGSGISKKLDSLLSFYEKDKKRTNPNLFFAYYYSGKNHLKSQDTTNAIKRFKQIDSLFIIKNDLHPELRKTYEYLISYYQKKKDIHQELNYVKQLSKVDSLLNVNYRNIDIKIYKEYETPKLINKKDNLIKSMEKNNIVSTGVIILLFVGSLLLTLFLFINYRKRKIYHKRYLAIIEKNRSSINAKNKIENKSFTNSGIPQNIVDNIIKGLEKFEEEKGFTKANLNSSNLSSQLNTNTKYLSQVIKIRTGKTYTQYLNDIRIEYAIKKIQSDSKFRNYTIQAIAESVGFNTAEVFSKYFYKKTGIYPSYFVKEASKSEL